MRKLVVATRNAGKLREIRRLLREYDFEVLSSLDVEAPEVEEDGESFEANAKKKAEVVCRATRLPTLADDSGLEVDLLGGAPGVRSARFAGPEASDADNNARLMAELRRHPRPWIARYRAVLAFARPGRETVTTSGSADGVIVETARGTGGFGYDPYFLDPVLGRTFAELTAAEKDLRSHRGAALRAMLPVLVR